MDEIKKELKKSIDDIFSQKDFPFVGFLDFTSTEIAIINEENEIMSLNVYSNKTSDKHSKNIAFDYVMLELNNCFNTNVQDNIHSLFHKQKNNEKAKVKDYFGNKDLCIELNFGDLYLKKQFNDFNEDVLKFDKMLMDNTHLSMLVRTRTDSVGFDESLNESRTKIKNEKKEFIKGIAKSFGLKKELVDFIILKNKIKEVSILDVVDENNPILTHLNVLSAYREYLNQVIDAVYEYKTLLEGDK